MLCFLSRNLLRSSASVENEEGLNKNSSQANPVFLFKVLFFPFLKPAACYTAKPLQLVQLLIKFNLLVWYMRIE